MLGPGKKEVCSLLIHWQSQLHRQLSTLFKQRVSLAAAAIFCLCCRSRKQSIKVHCEVSMSSERVPSVNCIRERNETGRVRINHGSCTWVGQCLYQLGKSYNAWAQTAPCVWTSLTAHKMLGSRLRKKTFFFSSWSSLIPSVLSPLGEWGAWKATFFKFINLNL